MAKVLIGWEFGSGRGHLTRLLPIVAELSRRGHACFLAVQDLVTAHEVFQSQLMANRLTLLQAPFWLPPQGRKIRDLPTHSLADVLKLFSFHNEENLKAKALAWRGLLTTIEPDLILTDMAPTLVLSTGNSVPVVVVGNGYTIPPLNRRLPPIRPWEKNLPNESVAAEDEIIRAANAVRKQLGHPQIQFLADILSGMETFVCTIPELDPYSDYRNSPYVRPFNVSAAASDEAVIQRMSGSIFLYMPWGHPSLSAVLEVVAASRYRCTAFVPGIPETIKNRFSSNDLRFSEEPQPLRIILPQVSIIIHHGGLSTAYQALCAGTPQLVLPQTLEHLVTSVRLQNSGTSIVLNSKNAQTQERLSQAISSLLGNKQFGVNASAVANRVNSVQLDDPIDRIVGACEAMLLSRPDIRSR